MADTALMEEEYSGRFNARLWRKVLRYVWPFKRCLGPLLVVSLVTAGCDVSTNLLVRRFIDSAVAGDAGAVLTSGLMFFGVITLLVTCVWLFIALAGKAAVGIAHDIRRDVFARLQELEFAYYDRHPVGWLMARATSDCQRLGRLLAWGLLDASWGVFMMLALASVMLALNWRLALVVFTVIPLLILVSAKFQSLLLASSRAARKVNSQITASFNEGIMAVRTTKTLVREDENLAEFQELSADMYRHSARNALQSAAYLPIVQTIGAVGAGLALWLGGMNAMADVFSLGTMVLFINCAGQFFGPVQEIARTLTDLYAAQASAERVMGLLDTQPAIKDSPQVAQRIASVRKAVGGQRGEEGRTGGRKDGSVPSHGSLLPSSPHSVLPSSADDGLPARIETIEFRRVSFAYKQGQRVLENFNLSVTAGQTIALIGPTGGGKSTIVSLLCRFYEPTAGEVLINGMDYRKRGLRWLQSSLGIVLQTPHLFSGTVAQNIRYGRLDATDEQVAAAARLVDAEEFILAMDKGYDSDVGQAGNRLSMGQKQLISFARAVLADPQIFIMDEATSSIDTAAERKIQRGVERLLKGRTSFVIAHRLSTIRSADRILVIEGGRIMESGNHHELIRLRGRYYDLYSNQFTMEKEQDLLGVGELS
ncbi:MAG: ABC transporter ATP-binding protein [Phycisphaerae bacterium]